MLLLLLLLLVLLLLNQAAAATAAAANQSAAITSLKLWWGWGQSGGACMGHSQLLRLHMSPARLVCRCYR